MRLSLLLIITTFFAQALIAQRPVKNFRDISAMGPLGDKIIFSADDGIHGFEVWMSDGRREGTLMLKDINPQYGSNPDHFKAFNGELFFAAYHQQTGTELWKTDGTPEGTVMVKDLEPQDNYGGGSSPRSFTVFKNVLYFRTNNHVYKTDGTSEGTEAIRQVDSYRYAPLTLAGGYLYLYYENGSLFRTDGNAITAIPAPPEDAQTNVGGKLFGTDEKLFAVKTSTYAEKIKIYSYDESEAAWKFIKDFIAPAYGSQEIDNFTSLRNKLFFTFRAYYDNVPPADELWVTDGTEQGTLLLKSFAYNPHLSRSEMENFNIYNENVYFRSGGVENHALWKSDGTVSGTLKVHNVVITTPSYESNRAVISNGKLFFCGGDGTFYDPELWSTDGTTAGTKRFADLNPTEGSLPHLLTDVNDVLYFVTDDGYDESLWNNMPAPLLRVVVDQSSTQPNGGSINFRNILVADCLKKVVTVENTGLKELAVSGINVSGSDFFLRGEIPESVQPQEKVSFDVFFSPLSKDEKNSVLAIHTNDPSNKIFTLKLIGQSVATSDAQGYCESMRDNALAKTLHSTPANKSIALSNSTFLENLSPGSVVGDLTAEGLEGTVTYSMVAGAGDEDNARFVIQGSQVKTNQVFHYNTKHVHTIRVQATNGVSTREEFFVVTIQNTPLTYTPGPCDQIFERLDYGLNDVEINSEGHVFTVTTNGKILRSRDNGTTWDPVNSGVAGPLNRIVFKENTGYIVGQNVLLKSDDNGQSWFQLYLPSTIVAAFFLDEDIGFFSNNDGEIFKTTDGGRTWVKRNTSNFDDFRELWFWDDQRGIAIRGSRNLVKTSDGGTTWQHVDLSSVGWNTTLSGLAFKNSQDGFVIIQQNVYQTTDGGNSWSPVYGISSGNLSKIEIVDENTAYVYGGFYGPTLYKTSDGGTVWEPITVARSGTINGIATNASGGIFTAQSSAYGSSGHALQFSPDAGTSWVTLSEMSEQYFTAIDFPTEDVGYVFGDNGSYKTTNKGLTWKRMDYPSRIYESYFFDAHYGLISNGSSILKTTDGGATFHPVLTPDQTMGYSTGNLLVVSESVVFAYNADVMYGSTDGGDTWNLVASDGYFPQDVHFISPQVGYSMELFGSVRKTTDGGVTWQDIYTRDPNTSGAYQKIFFVDETIGYKAGNEGRISKTTDGGVTWTPMFNYTYAYVARLYFTDALNGYLLSRNGRFYETVDGAVTWKETYLPTDDAYGAHFREGDMYFVGDDGFVGAISQPPGAVVRPGYVNGREKVCVGDIMPYHLAANSRSTYQWSAPAAALTDEGASAFIGFPVAGEYVITVHQINTCGISEGRTLYVEAIGMETPLLSGPDAVAVGAKNSIYEITNAEADLFYAWDVTGDVRFESENELTTSVDWGAGPAEGTVNVIATDLNAGCRISGKLTVSIGSIVGVEDETSVLTAYPNPTSGEIYIQSHAQSQLLIKITDVAGRTLSMKELLPMEETSVSIRHVPAGFYILEIHDGDNRITKKIIKK